MDEISIVTDSTADLPDALTNEYGIQVVRNIIILNGKSLEDGKDITREEFYDRLPHINPAPTTSTASPGTYYEVYKNLIDHNTKKILSIHAPSSLSGIYNAASTAAKMFGNRVEVVDSGQVSLGLGFQVLAAAEAIRKGDRLESILNLLERMQSRIGIIAMLDTLEYVRRSGRVSWARARLGNLLQLKPFIELRNGVVSSLGESRTRSRGIIRLKGFLSKLGSLQRLAILHTNAESDAESFLNEMQIELNYPPLIVNVTTVIGTHVGPNGLGFAAVTQQDW
jgi:DegV family protein with EDD domain